MNGMSTILRKGLKSKSGKPGIQIEGQNKADIKATRPIPRDLAG